MSIVIDLNMVCLVCLKYDGLLCNIFIPDEVNPELQIAEKIRHCSDLRPEVTNENLPNKICVGCLNDLHVAWRFRKNCESAYNIFQTIHEETYMPENESAEGHFDQEVVVEKSVAISIDALGDEKLVKDKKVNDVEEEIEETEDGKQQVEWFKGGNEIHTIQFESIMENSEEMTSSQSPEYPSKDDYIEFYMAEDYEDEELEEPDEIKGQKETEIPETASTLASTSACTQYLENIDEESESHNCPTEGNEEEQFDLEEEEEEEEEEILDTQGDVPMYRTRACSKNKTRSSSAKEATATATATTKRKSSRRKKPKQQQQQQSPEDDKTNKTKSPYYQTASGIILGPLDVKAPKICEICGNIYRYQHALNAHMRRHNNDRPYMCEFCDKAFISNVELQRHIRVHTGYKPYACQYCERRFSDFGSRIKHERTHTGERPYRCETCGKSFAYAHVLSVHLRTHTGEKKFCCSICMKGFTKKIYLEAHLAAHSAQKKAKQTRSKEKKNNNKATIDERVLPEEFIEMADVGEEYVGENLENIDSLEGVDGILLNANFIDNKSPLN